MDLYRPFHLQIPLIPSRGSMEEIQAEEAMIIPGMLVR
jgi:hypothetical protein